MQGPGTAPTRIRTTALTAALTGIIALTGSLTGLIGCQGDASGGGPGGGGGGPETTIDDVMCQPLALMPRRLWRLSVQQYSNSVRDILGIPAGPTIASTGGTSAYAFFSDDAATVDEQLAYQVNLATRQLLTDSASRIPALAACGAGETEDACARRFAQQFGERAFRRPLDAAEVTRLLTVYTEGRKQDFNTGISLMVQALLQSPSFFFRSELGTGTSGNTALTPHEVATQLSYTLLDSTPDPALLQAADDGSLGTPAGVATQVDRLMATPVAQQNITRVMIDWFNVQQLFAKTKDPTLLAALGAAASNQPAIQEDLYHSARAFVEDVVWAGTGKVTDLVTSPRLFVNQRLATLYGVPFSGADPAAFVGVDVPGRAGMLTQPAVIWAASDPALTSIVKRGLFIHNDVICADILPPPGAILEDPEIQMKLAMLPTEIDKANYRLSSPQCALCHNQIDNYGFVLEGLDPIGRARTVADGLPVHETGDFSKSPPLKGSITGPEAFSQAIVANKQLMHCATQKMASYVLGRMIRFSATCEVREVRKSVEAADGKVTTLFREIATAGFVRARGGAN